MGWTWSFHTEAQLEDHEEKLAKRLATFPEIDYKEELQKELASISNELELRRRPRR